MVNRWAMPTLHLWGDHAPNASSSDEVDVVKEKFVGALMTPERTVLKMIKWHPVQTQELVHGLLSHLGAQRLEVVMESSGTYGDALRRMFATHGVAVFRLSPKRVHDSAEAQLTVWSS